MANFNSLKATIDAQIKANGVQAITGPILNAVLTAMINTIGNGYSLQGSVAQPGDNPGAPDNPVAYLAAGPGTYTNFGGTVIPNDGHAYLLTWDTNWTAVQLPLPTFDLANGKQDELTFDDAPTPGSDNPVKSGGIAEALDEKQDKDTGDTAGHVAVMDGNGNSVDGGVSLTDLATKADVEAVEQEVAQIAGEAGFAEAVIDTDNAGTEQEFTFRKSGGDGGAYYRKIKGKTIVVDDQLASNDAEAVETTGRNQYNPATGKAQVIGGTTYYIGGTYTSLSQGGVAITPAGDGTFTPASTGEVEVVGGNATDTIINISDADNGLWQPYWKRTLQLGITTRKDTDGTVPFADGMKGAGTAQDWADEQGGEKVMDKVDLGTLEFERIEYSGVYVFRVDLSHTKGTNAICPNYPQTNVSAVANMPDKSIMLNANATTLYIRDDSYTTANAFITAMSGVELVFELATPVPFTWAEPLNLGVKVDENGTERAVAPEGATAPSAPFVADTTYTMSIARMVEILKNI